MLLLNMFMVSNLIVNNNFINNTLISSSLKNIAIFRLSQNVEKSNIGIIDFRMILRDSNAMKNLAKIFVEAEKKINYELNLKQIELKKKEKLIIKNKNKFTKSVYQSKLKLFKEDVFKVQNYDKKQRAGLNKSFQIIQKQLKDLLAKIIKDISTKKNMSIVILKENIFIFNDKSIDFSSEALDLFNKKTKDISIEIVIPK
jgi:Skp family chaperone for outer membrane proteins